MLRMIRFELKKMYSNSVVIGSLAVLLLACFLILQAYCFNNSATSAITPDGIIRQRSDYIQSEYCTEIYRRFYR